MHKVRQAPVSVIPRGNAWLSVWFTIMLKISGPGLLDLTGEAPSLRLEILPSEFRNAQSAPGARLGDPEGERLAECLVQRPSSRVGPYGGGSSGARELGQLVWENRDVPSGGALMQTLDRRCQFARRREQQPGPEQLVGQVLDVVSHVADILGGVPKVR